MNRDKFEGKWHEFKGKLKEKWGKLTDNDITQMNGKYEQFLGSLQKRYGYKKEQAEREFSNWDWTSHSRNTWDNREDHEMRNRLEREENKTWKENDRFHEGHSEDKNKYKNQESKEQRGMRDQDMYKGQDREENKFGQGKDKNKQHRLDQDRKNQDYRDKKRKAG